MYPRKIFLGLFSRLPLGVVLALIILATSCTKKAAPLTAADGEEFYSYEAIEAVAPADPLRAELGRFFLVEHFRMEANNSMKKALAKHPPAGILFWNQDNVGFDQIQNTVLEYSKIAEATKKKPVLFSADYEGGGLPYSVNKKNVPGIQRFKLGFTPLAHPIWLGKTLDKYQTEACALHAEIIADELLNVGVNLPLTVVSDLAEGFFLHRGIHRDPKKVSACVTAMLSVFTQKQKIVFVTKHFPGLSSVRQDTHDHKAISLAMTREAFDLQLAPFKTLISWASQNQAQGNLIFMASHAIYPTIDPYNMTTESPLILKNLLRHELGYEGIAMSDAMWMGGYGSEPNERLLITYLNSILSGMDMLMIPGSKFAPSVQFLRQIYDDKLQLPEKLNLEQSIGMPFEQIRELLKARLIESLARLAIVQSRTGYSHHSIQTKVPNTLTIKAQERYHEILRSVGYPIR